MNISKKEVTSLIVKNMSKNPDKWMCFNGEWKLENFCSSLTIKENSLKVTYKRKDCGSFKFSPGFWNKRKIRHAIENLKGCKIALSLEEKEANKIPLSKTLKKPYGNSIIIGVND